MQGAPIPADESARLAALQRFSILDTCPEVEFDDFTTLASQICGTPIALISLIDQGRQWFKSKKGLDVSETPRKLAFCGYTILGQEVLEVANALEDERFNDNILVTGRPGIRFYAGTPLTSSEGYNVGTLCVIDRIPRHLSDEQRKSLAILGRHVVTQMETRLSKLELQQQIKGHEQSKARLAESLVELEKRKELEHSQLDDKVKHTEQALLGSEAASRQTDAKLRESLQRYTFLADTMPQIVWTTTSSGDVDYFNQRWVDYTGMSLEQSKQWGWTPVLHPEDFQRTVDAWTRSVATGCDYEVEYRFRRADGVYRWHLARAFPLRDSEGRITHWVGSCTDIDDQKRTRTALEERVVQRTAELAGARARLQAVLDAATHVSIIATDTEGLITVFNSGAEQILGYRAEEMVGKHSPAIFHLESEVAARGHELSEAKGRLIKGFDVFVEKAREGQHEEREWTQVRKDGSHLTVNLVVTAKRDEEGTIIGFLGVAMDISARKNAEETQRRFFNLTHDLLCVAGFDGYFKSVNPAWEKDFGYTREDVLAKPFIEFVHPEDRDKTIMEASRLANGMETVSFENRYRGKDGSYRWLLWSAISLVEEKLIYCSARDLTERKQAEETLRFSEERFRLIVDAVKDYAIFMLDVDGRVASWNTGAERIKGYTEHEIIGRHFSCFYLPEAISSGHPKQELQIAARDGRYSEEGLRVRKDGTQFLAEVVVTAIHDSMGTLRGFAKVTRDITDRKNAEHATQSALAEKEVLLREIHHRVKNNMQVISSLLQLQSGYLNDEKDVEIFQECQSRIRSMALVHERLYRSISLSTINFADYLEDLSGLIAHSQQRLNTKVELIKEYDPVELGLDTAIPLGLVANELLSNAFKHAFLGRKEGRLTVRLKREGDASFLFSVTDDGVGLPNGFATTKWKTLGMRLIDNLARQIRAKLTFLEGAEGGSCIELRIPLPS